MKPSQKIRCRKINSCPNGWLRMWKMSLLKGDQEKHMASNKTYWKTIDQLDLQMRN